jgi:DNA-binding IclR family transcriptional regulator
VAGAKAPSRPRTGSQNGGSLQLLDRTFGVLALFTPDKPEWTTTETARACHLPIPTAHRILTTLLAHGFVARNEAKRFRLGPAAHALGDRAQAMVDVRSVALPVLRELARDSGETAILTVLSEARNRSVCLERVESAQPLRLSVEPGRQMPLHAGASQKILLAYLPPSEVDQILSQPLEELYSSTITDPDALRSDLESARRRGWARSSEETNAGAWGLAVAILDLMGNIVAGVGLAGPRTRLTRQTEAGHLRRLTVAASQIARVLGHRVPAANLSR